MDGWIDRGIDEQRMNRRINGGGLERRMGEGWIEEWQEKRREGQMDGGAGGQMDK